MTASRTVVMLYFVEVNSANLGGNRVIKIDSKMCSSLVVGNNTIPLLKRCVHTDDVLGWWSALMRRHNHHHNKDFVLRRHSTLLADTPRPSQGQSHYPLHRDDRGPCGHCALILSLVAFTLPVTMSSGGDASSKCACKLKRTTQSLRPKQYFHAENKNKNKHTQRDRDRDRDREREMQFPAMFFSTFCGRHFNRSV